MFNANQSPRSRRLTTRIVATGAVIAASLLGVATSSAMADTSTLRLGCYVDSSQFDVLQADLCDAQEPALQYTVVFEVLGRSGGAYTYNWHRKGVSTVLSGCTSAAYHCIISVRPGWAVQWSRTVSVDVTELATGATKTVTAVANGEPVCTSGLRLVWC